MAELLFHQCMGPAVVLHLDSQRNHILSPWNGILQTSAASNPLARMQELGQEQNTRLTKCQSELQCLPHSTEIFISRPDSYSEIIHFLQICNSLSTSDTTIPKLHICFFSFSNKACIFRSWLFSWGGGGVFWCFLRSLPHLKLFTVLFPAGMLHPVTIPAYFLFLDSFLWFMQLFPQRLPIHIKPTATDTHRI